MNDLIAAVKAALQAAGLTVFDTQVPGSPAFPYVLLWSTSGRMTSVALSDEQTVLADQLGVTSVGLTGDSVRLTARRVRSVLNGWTPGVLGDRNVDPMRLDDSRPLAVDRDAPVVGAVHPITGVDLYRISSTPA